MRKKIFLHAAFITANFIGFFSQFFGYYPAQKASQLDPIEALRYE